MFGGPLIDINERNGPPSSRPRRNGHEAFVLGIRAAFEKVKCVLHYHIYIYIRCETGQFTQHFLFICFLILPWKIF